MLHCRQYLIFLIVIYFRIIKSFFVTKGSQFSTTPAKLEADLTADMLARFVVNHLQMINSFLPPHAFD